MTTKPLTEGTNEMRKNASALRAPTSDRSSQIAENEPVEGNLRVSVRSGLALSGTAWVEVRSMEEAHRKVATMLDRFGVGEIRHVIEYAGGQYESWIRFRRLDATKGSQ
jgi:hypothetical protein